MKTISPVLSKVAVTTGILLGAFAISALADWTQPLVGPPGCTSGNPGCDAPIHVGSAAQAKMGALGLNETVAQILPGSTFDVNGTASANKLLAKYLQITGGTLAAGNVLTSDASGNATWQTPSSGGSSVKAHVTFTDVSGASANTPFNLGTHDFCTFETVKYGFSTILGDSSMWLNDNSGVWSYAWNGAHSPDTMGVYCVDYY